MTAILRRMWQKHHARPPPTTPENNTEIANRTRNSENPMARRLRRGRTRQTPNDMKLSSSPQVTRSHRTSGVRFRSLHRSLPGLRLAYRSRHQYGIPAAVRRVERYLGRRCRRQGHEQPTFANDDRNHFVDAQSSRFRRRVCFDYSAALSGRQPSIISGNNVTGICRRFRPVAQWRAQVPARAASPRAPASGRARRPRRGARRPPGGW